MHCLSIIVVRQVLTLILICTPLLYYKHAYQKMYLYLHFQMAKTWKFKNSYIPMTERTLSLTYKCIWQSLGLRVGKNTNHGNSSAVDDDYHFLLRNL